MLGSGCSAEIIFTLLDDVDEVLFSNVEDVMVSCVGANDGTVNYTVTPNVGITIEIRDGSNKYIYKWHISAR